MDDAIETMRSAWAARGARGYLQLPAPGTVPVWIGGSSEAALRRSARLGDGWIPLFVSPADYAAALERLDKESELRGRDPLEVSRAIVVFVAMGGAEVRDEGLEWMASLYDIGKGAFERHLVFGDARRVARALARYYEAGAEHVAVFLASDEPAAPFEDLAGEVGELGIARP